MSTKGSRARQGGGEGNKGSAKHSANSEQAKGMQRTRAGRAHVQAKREGAQGMQRLRGMQRGARKKEVHIHLPGLAKFFLRKKPRLQVVTNASTQTERRNSAK